MSVPPFSTPQPSSTPPSKSNRPGESDRGKQTRRDFRLPSKDKEGAKSKEERKKDLFDLAGSDNAVKERDAGIRGQMGVQSAKAAQMEGITASAQVSQIGKLIQSMVETMRVGQIGAQEFASLELKKSAEVPVAFAGSQLNLSYQENGLSIHFDFAHLSPEQQKAAIDLVEANKEQLQQMVQALSDKNIQVTQMLIGDHEVKFNPPEPRERLFQAQPTTQTETGQRESREQERRREEGEGPTR